MIIKDWKNMFLSMRYFFKLIFISREYDVVFVSSAFFNRGMDGENLLFKPMVECCKKNKLNYIVLEDTDLKGAYNNFNRNEKSIPFDFVSLLQIILRKVYNLRHKKPITRDAVYLREFKISKILKNLFFKKFHAKVYITLTWNNVTLWRTVSPSASIVDYQHGIISDGDEAHMKDGHPPKIKSANDVIALVYGDRFKRILIDNDKTGFYSEKNVINVGLYKNKTSYSKKRIPVNNKKILFTLQITPDFSDKKVNELYIDIVEKLIGDNADFLSKNNYEIIFRHHPRFNTMNCQDIILEHNFVSFDNQTPMNDLLSTVSLHMTFHSTSVFEAAMMGLPTIFIDMHERLSPNEIFLKQYEYPCKNWVIRDYEDFIKVLTESEDKHTYNNYCNDVFQWSQELYHDFNESVFGDFLLGQIYSRKNDNMKVTH